MKAMNGSKRRTIAVWWTCLAIIDGHVAENDNLRGAMARGKHGTGVEVRDTYISVRFSYNGKRYKEVLNLRPTAGNIRFAEKLMVDVRRAISNGTFSFADFFPESKNVEHAIANPNVSEMSALFLQTQGRLGLATLSQYKNALIFWQKLLGADTLMRDIKHSALSAAIGKHKWSSAKLCNNYLIVLRGICKLADKDNAFGDRSNPMEGIANMPVQRKMPDPLELDEVDRILEHIQGKYPQQVANYYIFAFYTGVRPEEQIAMKWEKIDWNNKTIRVDLVRTFKGTLSETTKTYSARDVDLNDQALSALTRQKAHTFMKANDPAHGFIFENPVTQKPWHDERSQRVNYFMPALKSLGIRARRAYQTRHTYATMLIMAGANPTYVSRQLGHRTAKMVFDVYSKWIDKADRGREINKLNDVLSQRKNELALNWPQNT